MRRHAPRSAALLLGLLLLAALAQAVRVPGTGVQPLVSLTTLFAAEQPPACVRDAPSSRWAVVAAVKDKSKAAVFCYGSRAHKCYRRATCCAWYKNKEECAASLAAARDNREGTYLQQLHCGKQLCAANGKSGFGEQWELWDSRQAAHVCVASQRSRQASAQDSSPGQQRRRACKRQTSSSPGALRPLTRALVPAPTHRPQTSLGPRRGARRAGHSSTRTCSCRSAPAPTRSAGVPRRSAPRTPSETWAD